MKRSAFISGVGAAAVAALAGPVGALEPGPGPLASGTARIIDPAMGRVLAQWATPTIEAGGTVGADLSIPSASLEAIRAGATSTTLKTGQASPDSTEGRVSGSSLLCRTNAEYYLRTENGQKQIKITRFYGSWSPQHSGMSVWNRKVICASQGTWGPRITKYPSSNSYSYSTGWGYVRWYPQLPEGGTGAGIWAGANFAISGMGTLYYEAHMPIA